MIRRTAFAAALLLAAAPVDAAEHGFMAYDGDTLRATFRIANIDAPEIQGRCSAERALAVRARDFTRSWLAIGRVTLRQTGIDRYGRILATVERDGEDLGQALISAGLARPWEGSRRPWC